MKIFIGCILIAAVSVKSCHKNSESNSDSGNHLLKKTLYRSGKIKAIIAFNNHGLKDSTSTFYNRSGSVDSTIEYSDGKRNGITTSYYDERTEVKLYKEDSLECFSVYDPQNVLEYRMPLDTSMIKKAKFRLLSGRDYFDKSKYDTMLIITDGVPMGNRVLSIQGASMIYINDTTYGIRTTESMNKKSDSIIINIGIGYNYNDNDTVDHNTMYQSIRLLKK